jgi:hypothetical protein
MDECDDLSSKWINKSIFMGFRFSFNMKNVREYWVVGHIAHCLQDAQVKGYNFNRPNEFVNTIVPTSHEKCAYELDKYVHCFTCNLLKLIKGATNDLHVFDICQCV